MATFEIDRARDGQFYFRLKAGNGETILISEMYKAKASAINGIESVKKNAPLPERYEKLNSSKNQPYFVLKAANHEVIGNSEMYSSEAARDNGIDSVMRNAPVATVKDLTAAD
jgi:uncharacterized protein YegP (UPF0339 family)